MKKLLLILLVASSCTKEADQDCYQCTFGASPGGYQRPDERVCLDKGEQPGGFKDPNGNDISFICNRVQ